jgi:hypothetical protein
MAIDSWDAGEAWGIPQDAIPDRPLMLLVGAIIVLLSVRGLLQTLG